MSDHSLDTRYRGESVTGTAGYKSCCDFFFFSHQSNSQCFKEDFVIFNSAVNLAVLLAC